jgi:hypothetical protein
MRRTSSVLLIVALDEFDLSRHKAVANYSDFAGFWQEINSVWQGERPVERLGD